MSGRILIVDDERPIAEILKYNLEKEGYETLLAYDGDEALRMVEQYNPDLIILDVMMPGKDGYAVCREIRTARKVPIIMLTARETEIDKVLGLELGADDYVTKPFSAREVTARVKAVLRRSRDRDRDEVGVKGLVESGDLTVDLDQFQVYNRGESVEITLREFNLIVFLMQRPGQVYSREQLLNQVWGYDFIGDERTVDVTVRRVREKLEVDPANPEFIQTKRGVGYYFRRG